MYIPKIINRYNRVLTICIVLLYIFPVIYAGEIDLTDSRLHLSSSIKSPVKETIIQILQEEIHKRTGIQLSVSDTWNGTSSIALALSSDELLNGKPLPETRQPLLQAESFSVIVEENNSHPIVWLIGADERGVLFAAGHLLRTSLLADKQILFDYSNAIEGSTPDYPIRGHQLGYRNTANSYDAWSKEQIGRAHV